MDSNGAAGNKGFKCGETRALTVRDIPTDDVRTCRLLLLAIGRGILDACSTLGLSSFMSVAGVNGPKMGGSKLGILGLAGVMGCPNGEETRGFPCGVSIFGECRTLTDSTGLAGRITFFRLIDSSGAGMDIVPTESRFLGLGNDEYCGIGVIMGELKEGGECVDRPGDI